MKVVLFFLCAVAVGRCVEDVVEDVEAAVDITLTSQTTSEKLWLLGEVCSRWRGPVSLALWLNSTESTEDGVRLRMEAEAVAATQGCAPFSLTVVSQAAQEAYPVNKLRNLAIGGVATSHELLTDMDFLPSYDLRADALAIIRARNTSRRAFVVPAFQKQGHQCQTVSDCRQLLTPLDVNVPGTFDALRNCVARKECTPFHEGVDSPGHSTTDSYQWLNNTNHQTENRLRDLHCFRSKFYEPYLIVRHSESPPFDERFTGYGYNKIQHVEHLRYLGFSFQILPKNFLVHVPHPPSASRKDFTKDARHKVYQLHAAFIRELDNQSLKPNVTICAKDNKKK